MKISKYLHATLFLLTLVTSNISQAQNKLRDPGEACSWKLHEFKELGVRLNYKQCDKPHDQWELRQRDNWITQHRLGDDVIFGSHYLIQVFSKPENQSIEDAIRDQIISKIEIKEWRNKDKNVREQKIARKVCEAIEVRRHFKNTETQVKLELYPRAGSYRSRIENDLRKFPRDFGCGQYGAGQGARFFEYHPQASKTRFIFVEFGWDDDALFEENSIEIFEPSN